MDKIWKGGTVWVVEGVFDLFALNWAVPDKDVVLASLRARLTKNHINFLQRYASSVNLVYDRDEAGRVGTHRALKDFRSNGIDGRDFPYNGGKDPGELWDRYGSQGLIKSFSF
jgi:DNA primase